MNVEEISSVVVDMAFHLHRDLGPGLLESVYEVVLARMLEERGWNVKCLFVAFAFNDTHVDERNFTPSRESECRGHGHRSLLYVASRRPSLDRQRISRFKGLTSSFIYSCL
jgi:hypothetical protein